MKILRIGGKNLASLAGEFEVDFQQEPLVSAGLFAISGPTGAGKSTLLDALCLALYDATPRLARAGSKGIGLPDVRDETVTPQDTRNLLRRGAAEGYAEVDFVGNDGIAYRARWSVRRARSRADGALQAISMSLKQLPELQPIGGTNREVKSEIEQRIGLSFEQFIRAVLLAQNEFASFLKADDSERGELLETLTGTAVYTEISRRAFERGKAEQQALQQLNLRLADQKPLDQEARAQLEQDAAQAKDLVTSLDRHRTTLEAQLRWHQARQQMERNEQQAQQEVDRLTVQQQAAAPRRTYFARVESVQAARPLVADCERGKAAVAQARTAVAEAEAGLDKSELARQQADEAAAAAARELQAAEQAMADATPPLDRAKSLDARIETLMPARLQAQEQEAQARESETRARDALQQNEEQRARTLRELQSAESWLAQHAHLQALAEGWPRWETLLTQAGQCADGLTRMDQLLAAARESEAYRKELDEQARAALVASEKTLHQANEQRKQASARLTAVDLPALVERRQAAEARRDMLTGAEQVWRELAGHLSLRTDLDGKRAELRQAVEQANAVLQQLTQEITVAGAALDQAERSLRTAEAACGETAETMRAALKTGEPCPVCGATEHPYIHADHSLRAMLAGLQSEVAQCREKLQQLLRQQAATSAGADSNRRQLDTLARQLQSLDSAIGAGTRTWDAHPAALELADVEPGRRVGWLADQQQSLREQLHTLGREERAAREAALARDKAQEEFEAASGRHAALRDSASAAASALAQARADCITAEEKRADALDRLESALAGLDSAFDDENWRLAWRAAPGTFHAERKHEVDQWRTQCKARDERQLEAGKLEVAHGSLTAALARAGEDATRCAQALAAIAGNIGQLQAERQTLFGGKAAAEVATELARAIESAKSRFAAQTRAAQQRAADVARCREALDQARKRLSDHADAADAAQASMAEWIAHFNKAEVPPLDAWQLEPLLSHNAQWIGDERRQLQAIDEGLHAARTVLHERRAQRQAHEAQCPTPDAAQVVQDTLDKVIAERQAASDKAAGLQLARAQDDARRRQSASITAEIEKQESRTRVWSQLSDLIGSADGKKFRNYAQQFTLDVLLGYANRHLAELARRYRMERVKDTLALLVVDQDMGDEMRSVHSLSGGESFLASLALALGLASLSSNRIRVESLFIDEGFGSLDAETLSVAMDALDGLQAMGRKVGVISHVQEMTERIATRILVQRVTGGKSAVVVG